MPAASNAPQNQQENNLQWNNNPYCKPKKTLRWIDDQKLVTCMRLS